MERGEVRERERERRERVERVRDELFFLFSSFFLDANISLAIA